MGLKTSCLGYPRIGADRELKRGLERFWAGRDSQEALLATAEQLRRRHWLGMREAGIDHIPSNDFSLYDHVLDTAVMLGAVPPRYREIADPLTRYFAMARGLQDRDAGIDLPAMEMTKWFDTNYHYIVPEIESAPRFALDASHILRHVSEARALGIETRPVILGPMSFLRLAKPAPNSPHAEVSAATVDELLPQYEELLTLLHRAGVPWVQLDEPCLVQDLDAAWQSAYRRAMRRLADLQPRPRVFLATYFGALEENLAFVARAGLDALHVDLTRAPQQLDAVLRELPSPATLSLGLVNGRNVWRTDLDAAHATVRRAIGALGAERVLISSSCSLLHVPVDLARETALDGELRSWLAFAVQKLGELRALADAAEEERPDTPAFVEARAALAGRRASRRAYNDTVRSRVAAATRAPHQRSGRLAEREAAQGERFRLPLFPTTTIGSFPQTPALRAARAAWRAGRLSQRDYEDTLRAETRHCIERQEALGLDVLVHGEFERTDMVEHFGERLDGMAITEYGWVQSYGSRCVRPPIVFGDVARPRPMTVDWARYAQSLTSRPVKGMLTGPVTILQWSFVREDQPRSATCAQLALALRDEVLDLEQAGIAIIQVDEPALREGLPLRRRERPEYLAWAVGAFRLATGAVGDATQIHSHMCYSEFDDILGAVVELDADVLSIESSRSNMEVLAGLHRVDYRAQIGPGVYDIHSPRVPPTEEILDRLRRAASALDPSRIWVNPDCGLKTRAWPEVEGALGAMVDAARQARREFAAGVDT